MMDQAFFKKYEVELKDHDAIRYLIKMLKKIHCLAEKGEDYAAHLIEFEEALSDFKQAKS